MTDLHLAMNLEEEWTIRLTTARKTHARTAESLQTVLGKEEVEKWGWGREITSL